MVDKVESGAGADPLAGRGENMVQSVAYSNSEEMKIEGDQDGEIDGVDPWKAAMQVKSDF